TLLELSCALPVDVEEHVAAFRNGGLGGLARRSVEIAVDLRPLQQLVIVAQQLELSLGAEMVVHALDLTAAALARGHADGKLEAGILLLQQIARDGRLAGTGRG